MLEKKRKFFENPLKKFSRFTILNFCPKQLVILTLQQIKNKEVYNLSHQIQNQEYLYPNEPLVTIEDHESKVTCVCFSPCGNYLASAGDDPLMFIHDVNPLSKEFGKPIAFYKRHLNKITCISFSSCGKYVVTGSEDKTALISFIDYENKEIKKVVWLTDNEGNIFDAKFTPCGDYVAVGSEDKTVGIYGVNKKNENFGKLVCSLQETTAMEYTSLCFSQNGKYLITACMNKNVTVYRIKKTETSISFNKISIISDDDFAVFDLSYDQDGKMFAIGGYDLTLVIKNFDIFCDLKDNEVGDKKLGDEALMVKFPQEMRFEEDQWVLSQKFSPNGKYIVTSSSEGKLQYFNCNPLSFDYGKKLYECRISREFARSISISPDGKYVAIASFDKNVYLYC